MAHDPSTPFVTAESDIPLAPGLVDGRIVRWHLAAGLVSMLVAMLAGVLYSTQFVQLYPLEGIALFSPGRWRLVHTQGVLYGFLANAFLAAMHWSIPRLTQRPVLNARLSWFVFYAWQMVTLGTVIGVLTGHGQALAWAETPVWIDPLAEVILILAAINFMAPIVRAEGPLHVSLWYFMAALVWAVLAYAMGNFLPQYFAAGTSADALGRLFMHNLTWLVFAPVAWGLMYCFLPIILNKPIRSHGLALAGFWLVALFCPLAGVYDFLYRQVPAGSPYGGSISTVIIQLAALTVIVNFFGTIRGKGHVLRTSLPLRWLTVGMIFFVATCLHGTLQATAILRNITPFTDWTVAYWHLLMFGVFGFWILGSMSFLFPPLLRASAWFRPTLNEWHFWLSTLGMFMMFFSLALAGLVQGLQRQALAPWPESITASIPFWVIRSISGSAIVIGQLVFVCNVIMTAKHKRTAEATSGLHAAPTDEFRASQEARLARPPMFDSKVRLFLIAGLFCFALALAIMAVGPLVIGPDAPILNVDQLAANGIPHEFVALAEHFPDRFAESFGQVTTRSFAEALTLGHETYVAEGCWNCHTQQVRNRANEALRWGPVSHPREYQNALQRPALLGRRRVGPDLIRQAARQSNDWHIAHFYKPTSVVPGSVMPAFKWLLDKDGVPNRKGLAIIAYLQWLGSWHKAYPYWRAEHPPIMAEKAETQTASDEQTASAGGRFTLIPIAGYGIATLGFACLLLWGIGCGMFRNFQQPEYTMRQRK